MEEVPVTYVVSSSEGSGTDEDEELQRALRLSLTEQQQLQSPQEAHGAGAGQPQAPPSSGFAQVALAPLEHSGSGAGLGAASAPPLPDGQADWADEFWQQQPGRHERSSTEQQRQDGQAAAAAAATADAAARYDEQLAADEALAQSLHDQELQQLSVDDRERLLRLPALLAETPLVRRMSETLASLSGGSFNRLIPATRSSMQLALPDEGPQEEARRRLVERLQLFCLVERKVKGDGNCQFRALSDQLFRTPRLHGFVRECVVQQLRRCPEAYQDYVLDSSYEHYCSDTAKLGTWGDNVTLQAAADYFGVRIGIISSYADNYLIEVEPRDRKSGRVLWLSFWAEVHYNSLYPESEPPPPLPEDKVLGSRRLYNLLWGPPGSGSGPLGGVWDGTRGQRGGSSRSNEPGSSSGRPSGRQGSPGVRIIPVE